MEGDDLRSLTLDGLAERFVVEAYGPRRPAKEELLRRGDGAVAALLAERLPAWAARDAVAGSHAMEVLGAIGDPVARAPLLAVAAANTLERPGAEWLLLRGSVEALARFDDDEARAWVRRVILDDGWPLDRLGRRRLLEPVLAATLRGAAPSFAFELLAPGFEALLARGELGVATEAALDHLPAAPRLDGRWFPLALALAASPAGRRFARQLVPLAARSPHPDRRAHVLALHAAGALDPPVWLEALDPADPDDDVVLRAYLDRPAHLAAAAAVRRARVDPAGTQAWAGAALALGGELTGGLRKVHGAVRRMKAEGATRERRARVLRTLAWARGEAERRG